VNTVAPDEDLVLGVDQGTSKLKIAAFNFDGRVVAEVAASTPVRLAGFDGVEADPEEWWTALAGSLRKLLSGSEIEPDRIRGVGLCGVMHSLVLVDGGGRSIGAVPLWPDQRHRLADDDRLASVAAGTSAAACLGRLKWQLDADPETRRRVRLLLPVKDFLRYRLTGSAASDPFEARATGLAEPNGRAWSEEVLELLRVPLDALPPIEEPDRVAGAVCAPAAAETGLVPGTPVVCGTGDWHAALLGSAAWMPRHVGLSLGTAGTLGAFESAHDFERLAEPACFGAVTSTGSALQWAARALLASAGGRDSSVTGGIIELAGQSPPGARGVTFLPHLMGERGGSVRPNASGTLTGLRLIHGPEDLARGVVEGTAAWLRLVAGPSLAGRPFDSLVASGDGARSMLNLEIAAALYERPVVVPESLEAGTRGVAQLAAYALGALGSRSRSAAQWLRPATVVDPDPQLVEDYREVLERFRRVEAALRASESS